MILLQWGIIISFQTSLFLFAFYGIHLQYREKIEKKIKEINNEYEDIIDIINTDWWYQHEILDKRLLKKQVIKLKKELIDKNNLILLMQPRIKEARLYEKYFINNTKKHVSKT